MGFFSRTINFDDWTQVVFSCVLVQRGGKVILNKLKAVVYCNPLTWRICRVSRYCILAAVTAQKRAT